MFKVIAYADDVVLMTSAVSLKLAAHNLQLMCDMAALWAEEVKLAFNGPKQFFVKKGIIETVNIIVDIIVHMHISSGAMHIPRLHD